MKLLFDQNLSPRLVKDLDSEFPDSAHVRDLGMTRATDREIWEYAREHRFTIVSKDNDFQQMSFLYGAPPKVVWIQRGNCSVQETVKILRSNSTQVQEFERDVESSFLILP